MVLWVFIQERACVRLGFVCSELLYMVELY